MYTSWCNVVTHFLTTSTLKWPLGVLHMYLSRSLSSCHWKIKKTGDLPYHFLTNHINITSLHPVYLQLLMDRKKLWMNHNQSQRVLGMRKYIEVVNASDVSPNIHCWNIFKPFYAYFTLDYMLKGSHALDTCFRCDQVANKVLHAKDYEPLENLGAKERNWNWQNLMLVDGTSWVDQLTWI